jgi:hypothetical protein
MARACETNGYLRQPLLGFLQQLSARHRLHHDRGHVSIRTPLKRLGIITTRQRDRRLGIHPAFRERPRDFETVAVGKREIEQQQIRRICRTRLDRFRDGMRDRHSTSRLLEQNAQGARDQLIVFDNEDVRFGFFSARLRDRGW